MKKRKPFSPKEYIEDEYIDRLRTLSRLKLKVLEAEYRVTLANKELDAEKATLETYLSNNEDLRDESNRS